MKTVFRFKRSWMMGVLVAVAWVAVADPSYSLSSESRSMWAERFRVLADLKRGDLHDDIADLKIYLSKFGYLRISESNHSGASAEFDKLLEEAIKLYQVSFKLPVTGVICNETLKLLHTPRCGREDVSDDGRPLMLLQPRGHMGKIKLPTTTTYESHWAAFSPSAKWQSTHNLTFAFSSSHMASSLPANDTKAAICAAFATWSSVIPVNFTESSNFNEAHIQIKFIAGDHGDGDPFDGKLGIVAHSFPPEDGRFHFDSDELWKILDDASTGNDKEDAIDLETVALHEIGHLLGLAHTQVEGAVMYPSITLGQVKRHLTRDDIQGARALYGSKYRRLPSPDCGEHLHNNLEEVQFGAAFDEPH